jgi:hypothetical protein
MKDTFLPPINMVRRGSYSNAEALLAQDIASGNTNRIIFKPLHVWTEQDTTEQILERKQMAREKFGWEIDFEDYKLPFMKNVYKKAEKLEIN